MATVIATIAGIIGGAIVTYLVARRVIHRPKLVVSVEPTLMLRPSELDVHGGLAISVGGKAVANLCVLALEITCKGRKDISVHDAAPPRSASATPLPRIDFEGFRIIGIRTLNNDASRFYIPLSRHSGGHGVYLNIHRLRAGTTARFQLVGELDERHQRFEADQCKMFPGAIPDVDLMTSGSVARPWLTQ